MHSIYNITFDLGLFKRFTIALWLLYHVNFLGSKYSLLFYKLKLCLKIVWCGNVIDLSGIMIVKNRLQKYCWDTPNGLALGNSPMYTDSSKQLRQASLFIQSFSFPKTLLQVPVQSKLTNVSKSSIKRCASVFKCTIFVQMCTVFCINH